MEEFTSSYMVPLLVINAMLFLLVVFQSKFRENNNLFINILVLEFFYCINFIYHGFIVSPFSVLVLPFAYLTLFYVFPKYSYSNRILKFVFITLLIWCILPLIILLIAPVSIKTQMFQIEGSTLSLGGLAAHRNVYSFYVGLTIILTIFIETGRKRKFVTLGVLFIGIALSQSRSGIFAVVIALLYYFINKQTRLKSSKYSIFLLIASCVIFYHLIMNYGSRNDVFFSISDRIFLIQSFFELLWSNIFMGRGTAVLISTASTEDIPAHNFIIQTILDYGLLVAIPFFVLLFNVWRESGLYYKTIFLYLMLIGLSQPYFSFGVPTYFTLSSLLIAIVVQNSNRNFIKKKVKHSKLLSLNAK